MLVEEQLADRPTGVGPANRAHEHRRAGAVRDDVGPEPAGRPRVERQHRPVPLHRLPLPRPQDEPGPPGAIRAARLDAPATAHAQVAEHRDAALEMQEQVLADRFDLLESPAVDGLRHPRRRAAGMRSDRLDLSPTRARSLAAARWSESPSGIDASQRTQAGAARHLAIADAVGLTADEMPRPSRRLLPDYERLVRQAGTRAVMV